ncbi:MAG: hypothetical protein Fur0027_14530 [Raineya sp.]
MTNVLLLQKFLNTCFGEKLKEDGVFGVKTSEAAGRAKNAIIKKITAHTRNFRGFVAFRVKQAFDNQTTDFLLYVDDVNDAKFDALMPCSTRAGDFWVFNPVSYGGITGVAVLAEGYYPRAWRATWQTRFGFKSVELLQVQPVKIWRDGNKDRRIDKTQSQIGYFGINIHTAGWGNIIDRWSAGCIVVSKKQWDSFVEKKIKIGELYDMLLIEV